MTKYYRKSKISPKKARQLGSILTIIIGLSIVFYVFLPLISWQIYFAPVFANNNIAKPIPHNTIVDSSDLTSLFSQATTVFAGRDYNRAENWFPEFKFQKDSQKVPKYYISIPNIKLKNAEVSTVDSDLSIQLVNYGGTAVPPNRGNAVIFGHSTLPQLYDPTNYKTIFANLYKINVGDPILISIANITYEYKVVNTKIVNPDDTSVFEQNFDDSYITLVTCTPPGTTWKRLLIIARLEKV